MIIVQWTEDLGEKLVRIPVEKDVTKLRTKCR